MAESVRYGVHPINPWELRPGDRAGFTFGIERTRWGTVEKVACSRWLSGGLPMGEVQLLVHGRLSSESIWFGRHTPEQPRRVWEKAHYRQPPEAAVELLAGELREGQQVWVSMLIAGTCDLYTVGRPYHRSGDEFRECPIGRILVRHRDLVALRSPFRLSSEWAGHRYYATATVVPIRSRVVTQVAVEE